MSVNVSIYQIGPQFAHTVQHYVADAWGHTHIWTRGRVVDVLTCQGYIAFRRAESVGLLTYQCSTKTCEIVTLNSSELGKGIGSTLLATFLSRMRARGYSKCYLGVLNDNIQALDFFQKRGFAITSYNPDCIDQLRLENQGIPLVGRNNIPLHGEYELALSL